MSTMMTRSPMVSEEKDDRFLLTAIARNRDQAAFAEFSARHQERAFSMALRTLRDPALADDAVQESMLAIWLNANSYQPERGSTRSWVLGIVMKKSLDLRRRLKQSSAREERVRMEPSRCDKPLTETVEANELIAAMRDHIDRLPEIECTLLTCCYGAGMTHAEIGKAVGLSQQTVSNKIQHALNSLRGSLAKAGIFAGVSLLSAENICDATTSGHRSPPGMSESILARVKEQRASYRVARTRPTSAAGRGVFAAGLAVVIVAAGVIGWAISVPAPARPAVVPTAPAKAAVVPPPAAAREPFSRSWDFTTREAAGDFNILQGSWRYVDGEGPDGKGCMKSGAEFVAALKGLGVSEARLPILITLRSRVELPEPPSGWSADFGWADTDYQWLAMFNNLGKSTHSDPANPVWRELKIYLSDTFTACWSDNQFIRFSAYKLKKNGTLGLTLRGPHRLARMTIQEIDPAALPDVRTYTAALEKIELSKRVGRVLVPELKSQNPPDPVSIDFFNMEK